jgi:hypothetical protein
MGANYAPQSSPAGAQKKALIKLSNPINSNKTPLLGGLLAPIATNYSIAKSLNHWSKFEKLPRRGSNATTKIIRMQHLGSYHRYTIDSKQKNRL